jgi:hypothetical protein
LFNVEGRAHLENTIGGKGGHIFRRSIHVGMIIFPIIYYWFGEQIAESISNLFGTVLSREKIVVFLLIFIFIAEIIRLSIGFTIYGQRTYEAKQISALAWGGISVCFCFLLAPQGGYNDAYIGLPIIFTISIVDPFLGETRKFFDSTKLIISMALILTGFIWFFSSIFLGTPYWLAFIMSPLAIASEWPSLKYIDDNATMILIPLFASLLLMPLYA